MSRVFGPKVEIYCQKLQIQIYQMKNLNLVLVNMLKLIVIISGFKDYLTLENLGLSLYQQWNCKRDL